MATRFVNHIIMVPELERLICKKCRSSKDKAITAVMVYPLGSLCCGSRLCWSLITICPIENINIFQFYLSSTLYYNCCHQSMHRELWLGIHWWYVTTFILHSCFFLHNPFLAITDGILHLTWHCIPPVGICIECPPAYLSYTIILPLSFVIVYVETEKRGLQ